MAEAANSRSRLGSRAAEMSAQETAGSEISSTRQTGWQPAGGAAGGELAAVALSTDAVPTVVTRSASATTRMPARAKLLIWSGIMPPGTAGARAPERREPGSVEAEPADGRGEPTAAMLRCPGCPGQNGAPSSEGSPVAIDLAFDEGGAGAAASVGPSAAERVRPAPASAPARTWRMFAVLLLLTVGLRLPAFFVQVFNSDETFLATQAEVINEGGRLYQDATDRKPPLVPYLYAATFSIFSTSAPVVGAGRRDARGGAHRAAPRAGSQTQIRRPCGMARGDLVHPRVGRVRAPGRASSQLRGLHAARDDRGGAVGRARPRTLVRGRRRVRDAREADGRGDAAPGALPGLARPWEARHRRMPRSGS